MSQKSLCMYVWVCVCLWFWSIQHNDACGVCILPNYCAYKSVSINIFAYLQWLVLVKLNRILKWRVKDIFFLFFFQSVCGTVTGIGNKRHIFLQRPPWYRSKMHLSKPNNHFKSENNNNTPQFFLYTQMSHKTIKCGLLLSSSYFAINRWTTMEAHPIPTSGSCHSDGEEFFFSKRSTKVHFGRNYSTILLLHCFVFPLNTLS